MLKITASFDDGCMLDLKLAKLCKKYKIPATFYIPIDYLGLGYQKGWEPLSAPAYKYLADNFEIGSHGVTHAYLTRVTKQEAREEIFESKKMLENLIGRPVTKFCYPRGYYDEEIKRMVHEAGYDSARTTEIGVLETPDRYKAGTAVHIGCPVRPEYKNKTWMDYGKEVLKRAKEEAAKGKHVNYHLWGHSWEIEKYHEWDNVQQFMKEIVK